MRRGIGRRGRPGLVGTVARTAVVAGTATAVSGAMYGHQQKKQAVQMQEMAADQAAFDSQAQLQDMQAQMNAMQAQQMQAAVAPAAAPAGNDMMAQLQQLTQMKDAGALTDVEFQAAKAKLLGI